MGVTLTQQSQTRASHRKWARYCASGWNEVHASIGSFADEHSTR